MSAGPLGCVLAGGRSTRMGRDKAMVTLEGRTLIERAVSLLQQVGCEVMIAGTRPDLEPTAPVAADLHPGCGPLAGVEAALASAARLRGLDEPVVFLPVDLPLLPAHFVGLLLDRAGRTAALATIPMLGGRSQPLCAVYSARILDGVSAALDQGERKVMEVIEAVVSPCERDVFDVESVLPGHAAHRWFLNLNTPADLAEAGSAALALCGCIH